MSVGRARPMFVKYARTGSPERFPIDEHNLHARLKYTGTVRRSEKGYGKQRTRDSAVIGSPS